MQHVYAVVGTGIGVLGTLALAVDLFRGKDAEAVLTPFRKDLNEVELASQELVMRMITGLAVVSEFIGNYSVAVEGDIDKFAMLKTTNHQPDTAPDPEYMDEGFKRKRLQAVGAFLEAQESLPTREQTERGLALIREARKRVERQFEEQVHEARNLKIVATFGVGLVCLGSLALLLDLFIK